MPYRQTNGSYRATKMIDGKRRQKIFRTLAEAKKWEAGQSLEEWTEKPPTLSVLSLATQYLAFAKERFSQKTFDEKRVALRNAIRFLGPEISADEIKPKDILDALTHRAIGSGNAANKDRKNLIAMWAWGVRYFGLSQVNPFKVVDRFAYDHTPRYVPKEADFWRAHDAASLEDQTFLLTALHTAARRGELFRLTWGDIDFQAPAIRLGTRKTKSGGLEYSTIPMTSALKRSLAAHRARGPRSLLVFCQEDGEPYTSRQHYMERLCKRAGVEPFGFHAIRHLSASILAREGVDIPTIQAVLRHKSPTTTARYLRSLGVVANVLEDVFCGKEKAPGGANSEGF
jgi:integrase